MKALAAFVDSLTESGEAHVVETSLALVSVFRLSAKSAERLILGLTEVGMTATVTDDADQVIDPANLVAGVAPYSVVFSKPISEGTRFFLSTDSFRQWLKSPDAASAVRVAASEALFVTELFPVLGWEEEFESEPSKQRKCPRRVVRDATGSTIIPADVRPFLLVEESPVPAEDQVFQVWASVSARNLLSALATEVPSLNRLEFVGPPRLEITDLADVPIPDWLKCQPALQEAVRWVYDLDREVELRHRLFSQEFARLAYGHLPVIGESVGRFCFSAIEGAKIVYGFHVHEISKDALKSLSDLRKVVSDDTQKLFEVLRQMALSAAAALFYVIGLVSTRLAAMLNPIAFDFLLLIGMVYVAVVVSVNHRSIQQQRDLRELWRTKVYRYLTDSEYAELVEVPMGRAEKLLVVLLWCVTSAASASFVAAAWFW